MNRVPTLAEKLSLEDDKTLYSIFEELRTGVVPAAGHARKYCKQFNNRIDRGDACIKLGSYGHVYLPTLNKAVMYEISVRRMDRYVGESAPKTGMTREQIRMFIESMSASKGFYGRLRNALTDEDYKYLESLNLQTELDLIERLEGC